MAMVTFQILDGVDKGLIFCDLPTPVTIGREEGNVLRLNDERVSRFHAKIQSDNGEIILTDLESTNGTRVNGNLIQIRRLRPGDRIGVGRSLLLFGSGREIANRRAALSNVPPLPEDAAGESDSATLPAKAFAAEFDHDLDFDLSANENVTDNQGALFFGTRPLPPLPQKLTPAQAARLAELLDFLHRHLTSATDNIQANEPGTEIKLGFNDWQRVLSIQLLLARYARAVAEPDVLDE